MRCIAVVYIFILLMSCSSKITTGGSGDKYSEDLSVLRDTIEAPVDTIKNATASKDPEADRNPTEFVEARHNINASLDMVLDSIDRINVSRGLVDGFTIQLYSGVKREAALDVIKQVSTALPDLDANLRFVQPNFRVRAGKYTNRFEAHEDYMKVKKFFPNAVIIPDRIPIR